MKCRQQGSPIATAASPAALAKLAIICASMPSGATQEGALQAAPLSMASLQTQMQQNNAMQECKNRGVKFKEAGLLQLVIITQFGRPDTRAAELVFIP